MYKDEPSLEITFPGIPTTTALSGISLATTQFAPKLHYFPLLHYQISFLLEQYKGYYQ